MVEHGHHEERIPTNPVDQGDREPAEQDAAAPPRDRGERFWIADCGRHRSIDGSSELQTKADGTGLVPRLCFQDLGPGLRPNENVHQ